jgi:cholest-4-en-3-one 26-monooxygenase
MTSTTAQSQVDLIEVDLTDPGWFRDGPPHELFARMRAEAPVRWNEAAVGDGFWSVTRHAEVSAISRDTETFSSFREGIFLDRDRVTPLELNRNLLLYKDPPEHTKYRRILQSAFVPHTVRQLEDGVRARVTRVIDEVIERGACDFVSDVAVPIPLGVLAELMGLPDEDIPRLYGWTEQIEQAQRSPEPAAATGTFVEMAAYLHEQIASQAERGGDSLVMRLRDAEVDGQRLDDSEILVFFGLLVFAGNDTTRNTTSAGMHALLEHPDQLALLREDFSLIPAAVEEMLRYTSVVNYFIRTATRDTELGGQRIAEGEKVLMWYTSASRDEALYTDPKDFDVTRPEHDHSAFGGGGRHFCLGAGLARLELRIVFEEILRRMDAVAQSGPLERVRSTWANSLSSLPVTFVASRRLSRSP